MGNGKSARVLLWSYMLGTEWTKYYLLKQKQMEIRNRDSIVVTWIWSPFSA